MKPRAWSERKVLRSQRRLTGRTAIRVTRATHQRLRELQAKLPPHSIRGLDELVYELATDALGRIS